MDRKQRPCLHKTCTDNKDVCNIFGNIPKTKVRYMPLLYQQSKTPPLPEATSGHAGSSGQEESISGSNL
jgi:hypothetical protein